MYAVTSFSKRVNARSNNRVGVNKFSKAPKRLNRSNNSRTTRPVNGVPSKVNAASHNINTFFGSSRESTIHVRGLPTNVSKQSIFKLFDSNVGGVTKNEIIEYNTGKEAFIGFRNLEKAKLALLKFNNETIQEINNGSVTATTLKVDIILEPSLDIKRDLFRRIDAFKKKRNSSIDWD